MPFLPMHPKEQAAPNSENALDLIAAERELLRICHLSASVEELMHQLIVYFKGLTGCEAVGVRLRQGEDFPYYETSGFPEEFVRAERFLCARDPSGKLLRGKDGNPVLECMCGNILCERFNPAQPFFSRHGSFWTNSTTHLLAGTTEQDRQSRTRNRCHGEGYESVALLPLRAHGKTFGLVQFNDRRADRFSPDRIEFLEQLVDYAALAVESLENLQALHESEERFRRLAENAPDMIFRFTPGPEFKLTYINAAVRTITGLDPQDCLNDPKVFSRIVHPEDLPLLQRMIQGIEIRQEPIVMRWLDVQGQIHWVEIHLAPLFDDKGNLTSVEGVTREISERKRLEQEAKRSAQLLTLFVENVPAGIAMFDREMRYLAVSRRFLEDNHISDQSILGRCHYDVFPEIPERWRSIHQRCLQGLSQNNREDAFVRADGSFEWVSWRVDPWYESPGVVGGIILFSEIISEQKKIILALQESEKKFHDLFDKHAAVKLLLDPATGQIVDANAAAGKFYGWTVDQLKQMRIQEINPQEPGQTLLEFNKAQTQQRVRLEFVHRLADGSLRDVEVYSSSVEINGKTLLHFIIHDVTAQKQAAETLRVSEDRFRILTELLPVAVYLTDAGGQFLFCNDQWYRQTGLSIESSSMENVIQAVHPEDRAALLSAMDGMLESGGKLGQEFRLTKPDGAVAWVYGLMTKQLDDHGQIVGYIGTLIDITQRKQAELQLNEQFNELRRWSEITMGRESRILQLKQEINELLARLGEAPRYASVAAEVRQ